MRKLALPIVALTISLMTICWPMPSHAGNASGRTAASVADVRDYSTLPAAVLTDSCAIYREQAGLFREAYRLRLHDIITERARADSLLNMSEARYDSLGVINKWLRWELEGSKLRERRWYDDTRVQFLAGGVAFTCIYLLAGVF